MRNQIVTEQTLFRLVGRLGRHLSKKRKIQTSLLLGLMVLTSFAEMLSIGAVLPFLSALTQPAAVFEHPRAQWTIQQLGLSKPEQIILPLTLAFIVSTIAAGGMRVFFLWVSTKFSFAVGCDLSNRVYRTTLYQPYSTHIERNSSEVVDIIWTKVSEVIFYILLPGMTVFSSCLIIAVICTTLLLSAPSVTLWAFGSLALTYILIVRFTKHRLKQNSEIIARESSNVVKTLQEGLGGIRDILIDGSQENFSNNYRNINQRLRKAQGQNQIMSVGPRYIVEVMGMLAIAFLAYILSQQPNGVATALPTLAVMALGMQRLLPAAQQMYNGWSLMHGAQASLKDVLKMLEQRTETSVPCEAIHAIDFRHTIRLKEVAFRYNPQAPWILKDLNLVIKKGSRIGFIGTTGCGKSTLMDIVMGLLQPSQGSIEIDGKPLTAANQKAWRSHIAHVPQTVFLADCSIAENIAFGVPRSTIDQEQVRKAAERAQLSEIIESWPEGYSTRVGERGVQLSGGQRQRIGIARALYKNADVIVLDEATSALDTETEEAVMRAVESLDSDITILMIAHRLNTLSGCTHIVELGKGGAIKQTHTAVDHI